MQAERMRATLAQLVARFGGELHGAPELEVAGVAPLESAGPAQISFLSNPRFKHKAASSQAAALIAPPAMQQELQGYGGALILHPNPYLYYAWLSQYFAPPAPLRAGVAPSAVLGQDVEIDPSAQIGPQVVLEDGVKIGARVRIDAACVIGAGVEIGPDTHIFPRVVVYAGCVIGARCTLHAGSVIGADGFGFANDAGAWVKIAQTGRVVIGDDVDIGANTCIDRGALDDTIISNGVKLDNQIQIGHNCKIGAHTAMAGCVGVAGSAVIGSHCTFGGAAMVLGHLEIADRVHISSGSMVTRSIHEPGQYTGLYPLAKNSEWEKSAAVVRNLASLREKIRALEKQLKSLNPQNPS
ncbi:UDP-3-O-(3-hydroxymyristoyl)glucosamine N-acyltransferase [Massilia sp. W12]|uniref:UDP-3-O-(3-hydroxymyristoyl)glucosamine N-acyltransferase n=2 Tax=Massilia sp. W12 TaxID=3126507 RepID=UPI0030D54765